MSYPSTKTHASPLSRTISRSYANLAMRRRMGDSSRARWFYDGGSWSKRSDGKFHPYAVVYKYHAKNVKSCRLYS